ncbi:MAG: DUF1015 domain-containing protein [Spirochaetaceae bacterium]|jgi:hypothetical protein|nr:DUF1015 domain-containing protein [Spirochaetaceae bacterium]
MHKVYEHLAFLGIKIPQIILPAKNVDLQKWAVVACDQFTQDAGYWEKAAAFTGRAPSTLNIIYPEIYLNQGGSAERIDRIHKTMRGYLAGMFTADAILNPPRQAGAFIERTTQSGTRRGLMFSVDLERYGWRSDSQSIIRATEGTVPERLPPRMEVRRGAAMETPHIMLLINDHQNILVSLLLKLLVKAPVVYNTPLMMGGGSVRCKFLYRKNDWALIVDVFEHLARESITRFNSENPLLFAVGDGNHSLAAAKAVWDEYKAAHAGDDGINEHPARYALVEVVNLYDPAIIFEPIHRIVFNTDADKILGNFKILPDFSFQELDGVERLRHLVSEAGVEENRCGIISGKRCVLVKYSGSKSPAVDIDPLLANQKIDYIHGAEELFHLAASPSAAGILFPPFNKNGLFETIAKSGPLPRKSFSMGSASEKRYYLECRQLFS